MKKWIFLSALTFFGLIGCSNQSTDEATIQKLENQNNELKREINSLKDNQAENKTNSTNQTQQSNIPIINEQEMQAIQTKVANIVKDTNSLKPTGTKEEQLNQFFSAKKELDFVDNQIDSYDDNLESSYHNGQITLEKYKAIEIELDKLEDQLDIAEDSLELLFGIDD